MPANAAIYLPHEELDLAAAAPWIQVVARPAPGAEHFDCLVDGDAVRFNVMTGAALTQHLRGLRGWLATQDLHPDVRTPMDAAVTRIRTTLGLRTDREFEDNHRIWECLFAVAGHYDGFVFTYNSVLLPGGEAVCGPLREGR